MLLHVLLLLLTTQLPQPPIVAPEFEAQVIDDQVAIGYGLAIGDVDGDGRPDILLADKKAFVWYRNGDWKRFVMAENLTESDNVCIAARDLDGDGKVEVAVGAQWNPGETSDPLKSGSVHYLIRPADPTQPWEPVALHHEPTVHRMRWVKIAKDQYQLVVVPLHGRGNKGGEGLGVKVMAYDMPPDPHAQWKHSVIDESMHLTHNLELLPAGDRERLYIGGKEGVKELTFERGRWTSASNVWFVQGDSFGELRFGTGTQPAKGGFLAGIQPMHGTDLVVYARNGDRTRSVLATNLNQGHALATGDLVGNGNDEIVVGWREPNAGKQMGIKIFVADPASATGWADYWVDEGGIACEDLQLADLDGDGRSEIIAAGRASRNLKIYWNKNK